MTNNKQKAINKALKDFANRLNEELIKENIWDDESMGIIEQKIEKVFKEMI